MSYIPEQKKAYAIKQSEEISKKLEKSLENLYNGEQYKEWLNVASKFHKYSLNNQILIMSQRPDATNVASFTKWKELERNVNKGAKGIKIFAPMHFKKEVDAVQLDENRQPICDSVGKPITKKKEVEYTTFKAVTVFDLSDTNGKPLPTLAVDELKGNVDQYPIIKEALEKVSPVPVSYEEIHNNAKGFFSGMEQKIVIKKDMDEIATIKTLAHEISHSLLHDKEKGTLIEGLDETDAARNIKEIQAESCAYILCNHLGLDTSDYSVGYVAGWENKPTMEDFKQSLDTIRITSAKLIDDVDKNIIALSQDRLIDKYKDLDINYHIDECMEFPVLGKSYEFNNIDDALEKYKTMPNTSNIKDLVIDAENKDVFVSVPILMNSKYNDSFETEHAELLNNPTIKDIVDKAKNYSIKEKLDNDIPFDINTEKEKNQEKEKEIKHTKLKM